MNREEKLRRRRELYRLRGAEEYTTGREVRSSRRRERQRVRRVTLSAEDRRRASHYQFLVNVIQNHARILAWFLDS